MPMPMRLYMWGIDGMGMELGDADHFAYLPAGKWEMAVIWTEARGFNSMEYE
jgi:hypothetical protein